MSISLKPKFDYVVIKREKPQRKAESLIALPADVLKDYAPNRGVVVAVGPTTGYVNKDGTVIDSVTVGTRVIFKKFAGAAISATGTPLDRDNEDVEYWVIKDSDILCEIVEA